MRDKLLRYTFQHMRSVVYIVSNAPITFPAAMLTSNTTLIQRSFATLLDSFSESMAVLVHLNFIYFSNGFVIIRRSVRFIEILYKFRTFHFLAPTRFHVEICN